MLTLQYATARKGLPHRRTVERCMSASMRRAAEVTVRFVGTHEGRTLNRRFRGRDYATNVLTFVYSSGRPLQGDLVICAPVVAREAREQARHPAAHYAHLLVHGFLHLQGHDHEEDAAAESMEALERSILGRLGYPDPYA